jgi:TPP-dependent pyruvate/acetoin dehydrogenase alpha subunit
MAKGAGEAGENPLVPNAKLRRMYTAMLEARMLDEAVAKKTRRSKGARQAASIQGEEAVRVSTTIELGPDDLVSDVSLSAGMGSILGGDPASLLKRFSKPVARGARTLARGGDRVLPIVDNAEQRMNLALGAASGLKAQGRQRVLVAYARKGELSKNAWRKVLEIGAKLELPVIFAVLPGRGRTSKGDEQGEWIVACEAARAAGVPGMPVDACDAVALYRVVQESLGRARGGDGPVLIECVGWRLEGRRGAPDDPLEHLKESLLARKICTSAWFDQAVRVARRRLTAKKGAANKGS